VTPDEWRVLLNSRLAERRPRVELYTAYREGNHRLAFATSKFKEAFGDLFEAFATNWCALVVDSAVERLRVEGFRFGDAQEADDDAWAIWQANRLDSESIKAHTEAVTNETAYVLASPPRTGEDMPRLTIEHPLQCIVEHDPADRSRRLAALKRYVDANGDLVEVVYEPDQITTFRQDGALNRVLGFGLVIPTGVPLSPSASVTVENPLGVVPMVPLENNPDLMTGGTSDLKPAISLNDAANKFFSDMIVASEFQAFRQRVLSGVEIPVDPDTGNPLNTIEMAVSRLMVFEDPDAKAYDLPQGDLSNYVQAIDLAVQHLAAQTRTPPHYLLAKLVNLSGDALKAAESGLIARVERKQTDFSDGWEEAVRLAFKWRSLHRQSTNEAGAALDAERAEQFDAEPVWAPAETQAPGVISDSLVKKAQIGWPQEKLWAEGGMSPTEIKRAREMADQAGSKLTKEDVEARRAAGIPWEFIWGEMGYSEAEQKEIARLSPFTTPEAIAV